MHRLGLLATIAAWVGIPVLVFLAPHAAADPPADPRRTVSLNGEWYFRRDGAKTWKTVAVPSSFEDHEGAGFDGVGWYQKLVEPFALPEGRRALLHFQAAATLAEVSWNGEKLGTHLGGWTPFRFDVTEAVRRNPAGKAHEVLVRLDELVGHNTQGFLPVIAPHFGGIWQDVQLIIVPDPYLDDLSLRALGDPRTGRVEIEASISSKDPATVPAFEVRWRLRGAEPWRSQRIEVTEGDWRRRGPRVRVSFLIPQARLWSPEEPQLYEIEVGLAPGRGRVTDRVKARAGFRKVEASGEELRLNGRPLGIRGLLNWGYYPPRNHPVPDEARFREDLRLARAAGFNLMKYCLWVPPRRYLELADEEGFLAWMEYPTWHPRLDRERLPALREEFREFFEHDRNHPSIVLRSLTCETGQGADLEVIRALYELAHRMAPGTLVEDDSSWIGWNRIHDFYDDHPYGNNHTWVPTLARLKEHIRAHGPKPLVLGEAIAADTWVERGPILDRVGAERPFWVPGFFDDNARWLDRMRAANGPAGLERLEADSRRYGMLMRKHQVEAFRREVPHGGYVVSVIRDFSLSAMGLLDYLDRPKWSAPEWEWHRETLLIFSTEGDRRSFFAGDRLEAELLLSLGPRALDGASLRVALEGSRGGEPLDPIEVTRIRQDPGTIRRALELDLPLPDVKKPSRLVLSAVLDTGEGAFRNFWPIWVVPRPAGENRPEVTVATRFDDRLAETIENGGRVLLLPDGEKGSFPLQAHWFLRGGPYLPGHPLAGTVPPEMLVDLQHFDLAGDVIPEVGYLEEIDPLLMLWDNHDIKTVKTHGLVFETRAGLGRILVSALNHGPAGNAAGEWLRDAFLEHLLHGPPPRKSLKEETWRRLREKLHEERIDLTEEPWRFRPDPGAEGMEKAWHAATLVMDEGWKEIRAGRAWEAEGYPMLDGWAWYRIRVSLPAGWSGREVYLSFEGVDDAYEAYVNGALAGKGGDLATRRDAFSERKSHRITTLVKPGEDCHIAVRVQDWQGAGGIHRPVSVGTADRSEGAELIR